MANTVIRWKKCAVELRNRAAATQDAVARSRLLSLAEGWDMMVNGRMRILELDGDLAGELADCCGAVDSVAA